MITTTLVVGALFTAAYVRRVRNATVVVAKEGA